MATSNEENDITAKSVSVFGTELVESVNQRDWLPPEWRNATQQKGMHANEKGAQNEKSSQTNSSGLSRNELDFLRAVVLTPGKPCSTYNEDVNVSQRKAIAIRKRLVEAGYLREERIRTKKHGRTAKLVIPTEKACELFPELLGEKKQK